MKFDYLPLLAVTVRNGLSLKRNKMFERLLRTLLHTMGLRTHRPQSSTVLLHVTPASEVMSANLLTQRERESSKIIKIIVDIIFERSSRYLLFYLVMQIFSNDSIALCYFQFSFFNREMNFNNKNNNSTKFC